MDTLSQPEFRVQLDRQVRMSMSDGVEIAAVVVRPDAEGEFPSIMEYTPYRRLTVVQETVSEEDYNHRWHGHAWFAQRGYAVVSFDVRGTGNSGGSSQDIYSDRERRDAYEVVEWIASQPWCSGNVGMWGMSYGGVVQWQTAAQRPANLKTLVMGSSNTDVYLDWTNPGGSVRPYMFDSYSPMMTAYNFAPPDPKVVGPLWEELWQERLDKNAPWGVGYISNILQGPYWQDRSLDPDYSRVNVPVLFWCGWADPYPTPILRAFSKLNVPKKILLGPWGHYWPEDALPGPRIDFRHEMLRWYDRWLKEIDNDVMGEPAVSLFVREYKEPVGHMYLEDAGFWRSEEEWPPARNKDTAFYFQADGGLSNQAPTANVSSDDYIYTPAVGVTAGIYWGGGIMPWAMPVDQRLDEALSLTYTTPPLEDELEVIGNPVAVLNVASTAETAYFHVKLTDVAPNGTSKWLTDGGLLGTHRSSHSDPEPMEPGMIYELRIDMKYLAYRFAQGHRLRVSIASADFQNAWPTGEAATNSLHRSVNHPSYIELPLTPTQSPPLPEPEFRSSPCPPATMANIPDNNRHEINHDHVKGTVTATLERDGIGRAAPGLAHSTYMVSPRDPSTTVLKGRYVYGVTHPDKKISVESNEVLRSDSEAYYFSSRVEVTIDGERYFEKSWDVSVPRQLS